MDEIDEAIEYGKKQGFSVEITLNGEVYPRRKSLGSPPEELPESMQTLDG